MKAFLSSAIATATLLFSTPNFSADMASGSGDLIARATVAFQGQTASLTSLQRETHSKWFAEDASYEYSVPAEAILLSWHGESAIHQHLRHRADQGESIESSNVMFFPTNDPNIVFVQYEISGTRARPVVALMEMRGSEIVKIREFARAETIVDVLLSGQSLPSTALLQH
jgi:hypothetical protein